MNKNINFSIGPADEESHEMVLKILESNDNVKLLEIDWNGDHYSEIHCIGDYNALYEELSVIKHISLEHWEES